MTSDDRQFGAVRLQDVCRQRRRFDRRLTCSRHQSGPAEVGPLTLGFDGWRDLKSSSRIVGFSASTGQWFQ
jgi:hypothetical protein